MAAPTITQVYPADEDSNIPTGITIKVWFSKLVDLKSVRDSILLFGPESDTVSGPDTANWTSHNGNNPFVLTSPGFNGNIPLKYELFYYDLTSFEIVTPDTINSDADAVSENVGHVVYITLDPKYNPSMAANVDYRLYIVGDPDHELGINGATIFDVTASVTGDGSIDTYGTYLGTGDDTVNVKITTGGNIGTAIYKWWYDSEGEGAAKLGKQTARNWRMLDDGIQIRFLGSAFDVGDTWTFNVRDREILASSTAVSFSTNDGSFTTAPASPSTPATYEPPATILPWLSTPFKVVKMTPADGSYNVDKNRRKIVIEFSDNLDADSVTAESVRLIKRPVSGHYSETFEPFELQREIEVDGNIMTIWF